MVRKVGICFTIFKDKESSCKCTTLVGEADNRGGCTWVEAGSILEISVPDSQFCCELKTALKNKVLKKKKEKNHPEVDLDL